MKTINIMRNVIGLLLILLMAGSFSDCSQKEKGNIAVISTTEGDIKVKLYEKTPLHRDNFINLVENGFYDSLLFHRVIKEFMVQTGDPNSENPTSDVVLGNGGPGYTIAAEFDTSCFHKRGALAAARRGDQVNPEKRSSGSQFYIVQGKVFTTNELKQIENSINANRHNQVLFSYIMDPQNKDLKYTIDSLKRAGANMELQRIATELDSMLQPEYEKVQPFQFSEKQKQIYTTIGGSPHLDGEYTVFGEVVEGMEVVDKIANAKTNQNAQPVEDIRIISIRMK